MIRGLTGGGARTVGWEVPFSYRTRRQTAEKVIWLLESRLE